ncbi:MAG: hypothetical protein HY293_16390 [Planctomycetes bacterium]|nr:hypothetical protein [Planctomycetota bacterium]
MEPVFQKLLALPVVLALVVIVTAAGCRLVRALLPQSSTDERRLLGFLFGMAILSVATMGLLFVRLPVRLGMLILLAAGAAWSRREAAELAGGAAGWLRAIRDRGRGEQLYRLIVLAVAFLGVVGCLAPETGWDTGLYHFTMAQIRAVEGSMVVREDIPAGYRPSYLEMLQTLGFLFQGESLASLFNLAFYLGLLGFTVHWAEGAGGARARLLAGFGFLALSVFVLRAGGGDVEVGQAAYLTAALYALWKLRGGGGGNWRWVAGAGLGMALGIKYPSVWAVLALAVAWLVVRLRDRAALTALLLDAGIIGATALLIGSPWYLRNWIAVGNPVYPFLQESGELSGRVESLAKVPLTFAKLIAFDAFILAAVPALWSARTRGLRWIALAAGIFALLILYQKGFTPDGFGMMARYASPYFPGLVVLAALGVDAAIDRGPVLRICAVGCLGLAVSVTLGIHGLRNLRKVPAALGIQDRDAYLDRRINSYWAMRRAERELSPGRKILLIEPRAYYCRAPYWVGSDSGLGERFDRIGSAVEFRAFLDAHAFQFIVYSHAENVQVWKFRSLLRRHPSILAEAGAELLETRSECTLYRVR